MNNKIRIVTIAITGFALGVIVNFASKSRPSPSQNSSRNQVAGVAPTSAEAGKVGTPSVAGGETNVFLLELLSANADSIHELAAKALEFDLNSGSLSQSSRILAVLLRWWEISPEGALAWLRTAPSGDYFRTMLFMQWEKIDPKASKLAKEKFEDGMLSIQMPDGFSDALEKNPAEALSLALNLPIGAARGKATERALLAMLKQDPHAAFAKLTDLQQQQEISGLAGTLMRGLAKQDLGSANALLATLPPGSLRDNAILALADFMLDKTSSSSRNPNSKELLDWLRTFDSKADQAKALSAWAGNKYMGLQALCAEAARQDPKLAASLFEGMLQSAGGKFDAGTRCQAAEEIYRELRKKDPAVALQWVQSQPSGAFNPLSEAVLAQIKLHGEGFLEKLGMTAGTSTWLEDYKVANAFKTKGSLEMAQEIGGAVGGKLWAGAQIDPKNGANAQQVAGTLSQLPDDEFRSAAAGWISSNLASSDPKGAISLATLAGENVPPDILARMAKSLATRAPLETSQWLQDMPSGTVRDAMVKELAPMALADGDPMASFKWAATVSGKDDQLKLAAPAFAAWNLADPAAAAAGLESSSLGDDVRAALNQLIAQ